MMSYRIAINDLADPSNAVDIRTAVIWIRRPRRLQYETATKKDVGIAIVFAAGPYYQTPIQSLVPYKFLASYACLQGQGGVAKLVHPEPYSELGWCVQLVDVASVE